MLRIDIKPEKIIKPKLCACCKKLKNPTWYDRANEQDIPQYMYYGHSIFKNPNGDCSVYLCENCVGVREGYIRECTCKEFL